LCNYGDQKIGEKVDYRFKTASKNCAAERYVYKKENQEIKFGFLFESYTFDRSGSKSFLKNYDEKIGISIFEVGNNDHYVGLNPKKIIFFSETILDKTRKSIQKAFDKDVDENLYKFRTYLEKNGWNYIDQDICIWGKIKSEINFTLPKDKKLFNTVLGCIDETRDEIIKKCGYINDNEEIDYISFYDDFCRAINWQKIDWDTGFCYNFVQKTGALKTPILGYDGQTIIGQNLLKVSNFIEKVDEVWTEEQWEKEIDEDRSFEGPFETGNPYASSKGYYYGHMSLEDAFCAFSGDLPQGFRPAYAELNYENEGDSFNEYLEMHGEHPRELIEFMEKYEEQYYEN
jgi:hypothetical protein